MESSIQSDCVEIGNLQIHPYESGSVLSAKHFLTRTKVVWIPVVFHGHKGQTINISFLFSVSENQTSPTAAIYVCVCIY